jgi:hypothetical protein
MAKHDAAKALRTRGGVKITVDDEPGQESFTMETSAGQKFVLRDGPNEITISDANGNTVTLDAGGITVKSAARVTVTASVVEVNATAVNVNANHSKFAGTIQCDTIICNSVVSASYTPGAGNIM